MEYPRFQKGTSTHDDAARLKEKERIFRAFSSGPPQSVSCSTRDHHEGEKLPKRKSPEFHRRRNKIGMPTPHSKQRMRSNLVSGVIPRLEHETLTIKLLLMLVYFVVSTSAATEEAGEWTIVPWDLKNAIRMGFIFSVAGAQNRGPPILRRQDVAVGESFYAGKTTVFKNTLYPVAIEHESWNFDELHVFKKFGYKTKVQRSKETYVWQLKKQQDEPQIMWRLQQKFDDKDLPIIPCEAVVLAPDDTIDGFIMPAADLDGFNFFNPSANARLAAQNYDPPSAKAKAWFFDKLFLQLAKLGKAGVIHGDIKANNLLMIMKRSPTMGEEQIIYENVYFNDMDLSTDGGKPLDHSHTFYIAPEQYIGYAHQGCVDVRKDGHFSIHTHVTGKCNKEVDYFSAGMLLWEGYLGHVTDSLAVRYKEVIVKVMQAAHTIMQGEKMSKSERQKELKRLWRNQMKMLREQYPITGELNMYHGKIMDWIFKLTAFSPKIRARAFNELVAKIESSEKQHPDSYLEAVEYGDGETRRRYEVKYDSIPRSTNPMKEWERDLARAWDTEGRTEAVRYIEDQIAFYFDKGESEIALGWEKSLRDAKIRFYEKYSTDHPPLESDGRRRLISDDQQRVKRRLCQQ